MCTQTNHTQEFLKKKRKQVGVGFVIYWTCDYPGFLGGWAYQI